MGFFDSLVKGASSILGLNKKGGNGIGGFLNKAKTYIGKGMSFLNSKTGKNLVNTVSSVLPGITDAVGSAKKYGNIANNILNGAAEKKGERFIKQSPVLQQMDRWDQPTKPSKFHTQDMRDEHTIEKVRPRKQSDDEYGTSSMFA
jgi:hypothetical protein